MGTFATKKILQGNPSLIPVIAEQIKTEFAAEQFEVQIDNLLSGGVDISISKGGLFKAVLGLKSALKVSLIPKDNAIAFEAGIGIFVNKLFLLSFLCYSSGRYLSRKFGG